MTGQAHGAVSALVLLVALGGPVAAEDVVVGGGRSVALYPVLLDRPPELDSPVCLPDGTELVTGATTDGRWAVFRVTPTNGADYVYAQGGAGRQLDVDGDDFPTLARTGLHSEAELDRTRTITGRSAAEITELGRPGQASGAGFMAVDEDIVSVLRDDNRLVRHMELTHPQLARALFHVWNAILAQLQAIRSGRDEWGRVRSLRYNGREVLVEWGTTRGWQESIFADEIYGGCQITISRQLEPAERRVLEAAYPDLDPAEMDRMVERLTRLHIGEMGPFYVMRYGFYEGHTDYRAEPLAVALVFGLRSLEELEAAFPGRLPEVLTAHHVRAGGRSS